MNKACYYAGGVNYFLYGLAHRLCHENLTAAADKMKYSQFPMKTSIFVWRSNQYESHAKDDVLAAEIKERAVWADLGWEILHDPQPLERARMRENVVETAFDFPACPQQKPSLPWMIGD